MHIILDYIVDQMADAVEKAEADIDKAEEAILASPATFDPGHAYIPAPEPAWLAQESFL